MLRLSSQNNNNIAFWLIIKMSKENIYYAIMTILIFMEERSGEISVWEKYKYFR